MIIYLYVCAHTLKAQGALKKWKSRLQYKMKGHNNHKEVKEHADINEKKNVMKRNWDRGKKQTVLPMKRHEKWRRSRRLFLSSLMLVIAVTELGKQFHYFIKQLFFAL